MRTRDLGIVIGRGRPGPGNAITDVAGVRVGIDDRRGDGPLVVGQGPTGVTVVVPRRRRNEPVYAVAIGSTATAG
jgi:D-aminopeptidase